jgi:hypothetical protein
VIRYDNANGGKLNSQALKGNCGPGRDISAESLKAWTLLAKGNVTIRRYKASDLISGADHGFSIVEFPGNVRFIVDPTFGQFLEAGLYTGRGADDYAVATPLRRDSAGLELAHRLVGSGFVPLDADTAKLYVRGLGAEGAEIESAATRLLEGENALLLEVVHNGQVKKYTATDSLEEIDVWDLGRDRGDMGPRQQQTDDGSIIPRLEKLVDATPEPTQQVLSDLLGELKWVRFVEQQSPSHTKVTSTKHVVNLNITPRPPATSKATTPVEPGSPPPMAPGPTRPPSPEPPAGQQGGSRTPRTTPPPAASPTATTTEASTLRQLQGEITQYGEQGVPITQPAPAEVQHAETALKTGRVSLQNLQTVVHQATSHARAIVKLSKNNQPLTYKCMKGACGLGRDIAAASLGSFALESGLPVSLYRFQAESVFGLKQNKHGFSVVIFHTEPAIAFIVDPTFGQFINPQGANPQQSRFSAHVLLDDPAGARVTRDLLRDGFIQLDEQTARLYAKGLMGSDYEGAALERKASELGKKLLSGEGALTEEALGAQRGPIPAGAHRGPITHATPELTARVRKQADEIDDVESALELLQDYKATAVGDPQLGPIVKDLETRLHQLLENKQTPVSSPAVQPTLSTSPHPEPTTSHLPPAVEPGRPTPLAEAQARARQQAKEPTMGAPSEVLGSASGVEKLYRSKKFQEARKELQPLVDQINPCGGTKNCVPVAIAMDMALAQGKAFKAPVTFEETGFQVVQTGKSRVLVNTYEEVTSPRHTLEAYVGASMNGTGARGLFQEMIGAGHGARAIIAKMEKQVGHAYNVINWRGTLIAVDGQSRTIRPFAELFAQMVKAGDDWTMMWHRTN